MIDLIFEFYAWFKFFTTIFTSFRFLQFKICYTITGIIFITEHKFFLLDFFVKLTQKSICYCHGVFVGHSCHILF